MGEDERGRREIYVGVRGGFEADESMMVLTAASS